MKTRKHGGLVTHRAAEALSRAKTYAWRATATLLWLNLLLHLFGPSVWLDQQVNLLWTLIHGGLRRIVLAPTNADIFRWVAKASWLFLIAGFRFSSLMGFFLYFLFFPGIVLLYLFFRWVAQKVPAEEASPAARHTPPTPPAVPYRRALAAALIVWFLLYSDGQLRIQLVLGAAISGLLFLAFVSRALLEVRPSSAADVTFLNKLEKHSAGLRSLILGSEPKSRAEAEVSQLLYEPFARFSRRLAILLRGSRARTGISLYVLVEYLIGLLILAGLGTLFWAILLKAFLLPSHLPYTVLMPFIFAHFLPGIPVPPLPVHAPQWAHIGPSATFWILFVLYIGPASSLLPRKQEAYVERVAPSYRALRRDAVQIWRVLRRRRRRPIPESAEGLPVTEDTPK